jgi:hypothetical protein
MGAMRELSRTLVLCAALVFLAASAQATPLGLDFGDEVAFIEWDALQTESGDGGTHDPDLWGAGVAGAFMDGRVNSVSVNPGPVSKPVSNTDFRLDLDFADFSVIPTGANTVLLIGIYTGVASVDPDLTVIDATGSILELDLAENFSISGVIDTANPNQIAIQHAQAPLSIVGGDNLLVNALGGIGTGGGAQLILTGTLFGFAPPLANTMSGDNNPFNDFFRFSGTGQITVQNPSPFVPEPSTALLVAAGLLLTLAVQRRR